MLEEIGHEKKKWLKRAKRKIYVGHVPHPRSQGTEGSRGGAPGITYVSYMATQLTHIAKREWSYRALSYISQVPLKLREQPQLLLEDFEGFHHRVSIFFLNYFLIMSFLFLSSCIFHFQYAQLNSIAGVVDSYDINTNKYQFIQLIITWVLIIYLLIFLFVNLVVANTRLSPIHSFLAWKSRNWIGFLTSSKELSILRNFYAWLTELNQKQGDSYLGLNISSLEFGRTCQN